MSNGKSALPQILIIALIIVLVHIIVICCFWRPKSGADKSGTETSSDKGIESIENGDAPKEPALDIVMPTANGEKKNDTPVGVTGVFLAKYDDLLNPLDLVPAVTTSEGVVLGANFGKPLQFDNRTVYGNIGTLPFSKAARSGILVDLDSRRVLWAKHPNDPTPIASMVKLMTLLVAFEEIAKNDQLTLDTPVKISAQASKIGGSQVYLDPRETMPLGELMKAMTIKSANDAAYMVAEFLGGGNISPFVDKMNAKATELGLPGTHFINSCGLPEGREDSVSSPVGLVIMAEQLMRFPIVYKWSSTPRAEFREKGTKGALMMDTTNRRLLRENIGVDGLKTGTTNRAGSCITVTCMRNNRRMVAVVTGFGRAIDRDAFVKRLLDWGYNQAQ